MSKAAIRVQFLVIVQLQARSTPSGRVLLLLVFQLHAREVVILCDMLKGIVRCAVRAIQKRRASRELAGNDAKNKTCKKENKARTRTRTKACEECMRLSAELLACLHVCMFACLHVCMFACLKV